MSVASPRARSSRPNMERLESRHLLAAFGTPWPNARELTLSFPADGVELAGEANDLHATLDQLADRQEWQELALRAVQTWAYHADINVGLRADHDLAFGAAGLTAGDPRFGDLRIGATSQLGVLANSLPFQVAAGTYSGDIWINSGAAFHFDDWSDGAPDAPPADTFDLFSLMLHESGNALGLSDNFDSSSVMFGNYTVPKGVLTATDIQEIQALYGARTDPYEQVANDQLTSATLIPVPIGLDPSTELISVRGSLLDGDVDVYEFQPVPGETAVTVQLRTQGISLLQAKLEVLDASGNLLGSVDSESVFENDGSLHVDGLANHSVLYLRVSPKDSGVYSVGDYALDLDYRAEAVRLTDLVPAAYDAGIETLGVHFSFADQESGSNDNLGAAELWASEDWSADGVRAENHAAIAVAGDVDVYEIVAPNEVTESLRVEVASVGTASPDLRVHVVDGTGNPVGATGRLRPDGTWTLEVAEPVVNQSYFVRVSVDPNSVVDVGNYIATAEFVEPSAQMNEFFDGTLQATGNDDFVRWTSGKSKLYRFDLEAESALSGGGIQMTVYDAHTSEVRLTLSTLTGVTRSAYAMLPQGDYIIRMSVIGQQVDSEASLDYLVRCDGISDDQDPNDPDGDPYNDDYDYYYYEEWQPENYYYYYEPYEDPYYEDYYDPYYYYYCYYC